MNNFSKWHKLLDVFREEYLTSYQENIASFEDVYLSIKLNPITEVTNNPKTPLTRKINSSEEASVEESSIERIARSESPYAELGNTHSKIILQIHDNKLLEKQYKIFLSSINGTFMSEGEYQINKDGDCDQVFEKFRTPGIYTKNKDFANLILPTEGILLDRVYLRVDRK